MATYRVEVRPTATGFAVTDHPSYAGGAALITVSQGPTLRHPPSGPTIRTIQAEIPEGARFSLPCPPSVNGPRMPHTAPQGRKLIFKAHERSARGGRETVGYSVSFEA